MSPQVRAVLRSIMREGALPEDVEDFWFGGYSRNIGWKWIDGYLSISNDHLNDNILFYYDILLKQAAFFI